jgi:hypothetical protein
MAKRKKKPKSREERDQKLEQKELEMLQKLHGKGTEDFLEF